MKQMERGVMAEDEEKAEAGEVEKERGEQGSKVKQREMGVRGWGGGSSDHMLLGSKCQ